MRAVRRGVVWALGTLALVTLLLASAAEADVSPRPVRRHLRTGSRPPVAVAAVQPTIGPPASLFTFSGGGSADPDGVIRTYAWDFGDGSGASGSDVTHYYRSPGGYRVRLTVTDNAGLTGTTSLCLPVGPAVSQPLNVTHSGDAYETQPSIGLAASGTVHLAFIRVYPQVGAPDGVASDIFYTNDAGGTFAEPVKLSAPSGIYSNTPDMVVEPGGVVHVVFRRSTSQTSVLGDDDLVYATNRTGSFETLLAVDGGAGLDELSMPMNPAVAVDAAGVVHVAFQAYSGIHYLTVRDGAVSPPALVMAGINAGDALSLALDRDGWPHLGLFTRVGIMSDIQLYYTKAVTDPLVAPQFAPLVNVSNVARSVSDFYPAIGVDGDGFAHLLYRDPFILPPGSGQLFYVTNRGGGFDPPVSVPGKFAPAIVIDSKGFVHVLSKTGNASYANNVGGAFTSSDVAEMGSEGFWGRHHLAIGADGAVHVVYSRDDPSTGAHDVFYVAGRYPTCPQ